MRGTRFILAVLLLAATAFAQTTVVSVAGVAPAPSTTSAGTPGPSPLTVVGVAGGDDSNVTAGIAGIGGGASITGGNGGNGTGAGNNVGGAGGAIAFATGDGGGSVNTSVNANGGDTTFSLGLAGSGGSLTAGRNGAVLLSAATGNPSTAGGSAASPLFCGPAYSGICLYWVYNSGLTLYNVLAWRDITGGANQVSAGLDDQGIRIASGDPAHMPLPSGGGAIRFEHAGLTGTFDEGGIMSASDGTHTSGGSGTLSLCEGSDCDGTVADPHTGNLHLNNLQSYGTVTFNDGSPVPPFRKAQRFGIQEFHIAAKKQTSVTSRREQV